MIEAHHGWRHMAYRSTASHFHVSSHWDWLAWVESLLPWIASSHRCKRWWMSDWCRSVGGRLRTSPRKLWRLKRIGERLKVSCGPQSRDTRQRSRWVTEYQWHVICLWNQESGLWRNWVRVMVNFSINDTRCPEFVEVVHSIQLFILVGVYGFDSPVSVSTWTCLTSHFWGFNVRRWWVMPGHNSQRLKQSIPSCAEILRACRKSWLNATPKRSSLEQLLSGTFSLPDFCGTYNKGSQRGSHCLKAWWYPQLVFVKQQAARSEVGNEDLNAWSGSMQAHRDPSITWDANRTLDLDWIVNCTGVLLNFVSYNNVHEGSWGGI